MGSRRMENEEKVEPIGLLLYGERCDTPLWHSRRMEKGEWRMENDNYHFPPACGKNVCSIHMLGFEVRFVIHHALYVVCIIY
jgi:hypothetical protein